MRILHTSDWHLGKHLELCSRLPEQEAFIEELVGIVEAQRVDMILVSGDVYDTNNPPAEAERLFYQALIRLTGGGRRPILIIAGNHDSPERIAAAGPLAAMIGVIIVGSQKTVADKRSYGAFEVVGADEGVVELCVNGERVVVITIPYPSERRLNEVFAQANREAEVQKSYSEKIGMMFEKLSGKYRDDTVNIAMGHFYVGGGESSGSEREIQLGGSYAVDADALPKKAQYIAMGHLHRPQQVKGLETAAYYSGSPLQYSKNEIGYAKCVYIIDVHPMCEPIVEKVYLRNYKPIQIWKAQSAPEAIGMCEAHAGEESWVFLEVKTDRALLQSEIRQMKSAKADIVEIRPVIEFEEQDIMESAAEEKSLREEFADFYREMRGVEPAEDLVSLFLSLGNEEDAP